MYVSDMIVAHQRWYEANVDGALELLNRYQPQEREDLRGFEWYYLWD